MDDSSDYVYDSDHECNVIEEPKQEETIPEPESVIRYGRNYFLRYLLPDPCNPELLFTPHDSLPDDNYKIVAKRVNYMKYKKGLEHNFNSHTIMCLEDLRQLVYKFKIRCMKLDINCCLFEYSDSLDNMFNELCNITVSTDNDMLLTKFFDIRHEPNDKKLNELITTYKLSDYNYIFPQKDSNSKSSSKPFLPRSSNMTVPIVGSEKYTRQYPVYYLFNLLISNSRNTLSSCLFTQSCNSNNTMHNIVNNILVKYFNEYNKYDTFRIYKNIELVKSNLSELSPMINEINKILITIDNDYLKCYQIDMVVKKNEQLLSECVKCLMFNIERTPANNKLLSDLYIQLKPYTNEIEKVIDDAAVLLKDYLLNRDNNESIKKRITGLCTTALRLFNQQESIMRNKNSLYFIENMTELCGCDKQ